MKPVFTLVVAALAAFPLRAQVALSPATPAISPSPVFVPGAPAMTAPTTATGNVVITNASLLALSESLLALQTNLEQTLPNLILFNDNFDFVSLGNNGVAAPSNPPGNFAVNFGTNFAVNAGVNYAVPTGTSLFNTVANHMPAAAAGLPQGVASVPLTRDTLRALLVLQADLQRITPVVNFLNGAATNAPGSFTNLFGVVPTTP